MGKAAIVITLMLLLVAPVPAGALELYMRRTVFLEDAIPTIADLVHAGPGQTEFEVLQTRLPFAVQRLTLLPAATIRQILSKRYGGILVIAGGRAALLPPELAVLPEAGFYRDLLRYIDDTEEQRKDRVELEFLGEHTVRGYDQATTPRFIMRPIGGATEVSYRTPAGANGLIRLRIHRYSDSTTPVPVPHGRMASDQSYALRSGDRIRIRFVRGSVTVAVPGRAFRSGRQGDTIPVRPYDSQERFDGLIVGQREVLVELQ